jgi:hypothetical protein
VKYVLSRGNLALGEGDMQIGCHKKLLEYLGKKPQPRSPEEDSLLGWSATLQLFNRRRIILVANDETRYNFIFYGIKKGDLKNFDDLLLGGIRSCFEQECISPAIFDKYIAETAGGAAIKFTKSPSPKITARLRELLSSATQFQSFFSLKTLLQFHITPSLNSNTFLPDEYCEPIRRTFVRALKKRYGEDIFASRAVELEITLGTSNVFRRRIVVPIQYNFRELHYIIVTAFGWPNSGFLKHFLKYNYWLEKDSEGRPLSKLESEEPAPSDISYESRLCYLVTLDEVFSKYSAITYNYRLEDGWAFAIKLVGFQDNHDKPYPVCVEGSVFTLPVSFSEDPPGSFDIDHVNDQLEKMFYKG